MNHLTLDPEAEIYVSAMSDTLIKKDMESICPSSKLHKTRCLPLKNDITKTKMDAKIKGTVM